MTNQPQPASDAESGILVQLHRRLEESAQQLVLTDVSYRTVDSPIGELLLAATDTGLVRVAFEIEGHEAVLQQLSDRLGPRILRSTARFDAAARQLDEYFSGSREKFEIPLDLRLSTDFRRGVQLALDDIGYGQTLSYAQLAERVGRPTAVRAVGTACATNPLPLVLPCHRVLRTDGSLGGYLGGLEAKRVLLELENPHTERKSGTLF